MSKKVGKILVVEDDVAFAESVILPLTLGGFKVDHIDTRSGAIDLLKKKHYDVALVDLQLRDDITHKGGIDVLQYISKQKEGTRSLVLSGSPEIKDATRAYHAQIEDFIHKDEADIDKISAQIKKIISTKPDKNIFGTYPSLISYLAAPEVTPIWEAKNVEFLGCTYELFQKVVWKALSPILPVLRQKGAPNPFLKMEAEKCIRALIWSKAIGDAVELKIASKSSGADLSAQGNTISKSSAGEEVQYALSLTQIPREQFFEFVWDLPA